MPATRRCLSPSPTCLRFLRIGGFTFLGIVGVFLGLLCVHRGIFPILAWCFPQLDNYFYDLAVFGVYRSNEFVSFDIPSPNGIFAKWSERCDDGDLFLGPNGKSVPKAGPMITDSQGDLIWASNEYDVATNVRMQRYNGENFLTFWAGHKQGSLGQGTLYMLDSKYNVAHKIHAVGEGLKADLHEFQLTNDGTALISIYNTTNMDLRPMGWGRPKDGWIRDCIFQEVNIATGELLFQWRSQDYFKAEDTYYWHPFGGYVESIPFDFYHINSLEKDSKGNYLICARHFHTITYLNGTTGDIIWILGGGPRSNQFEDLSGGKATGFQWQHHARWLDEEEGIITVLDNGVAGPLHVDAPYSKGLMIQLDQEKMTAKFLQDYVSNGKTRAASQGSLQSLPNGNLLAGWGSSAAWSEYTRDGELLCENHFAASWTFWWERVKNYRVFKHHGWVGTPEYPPVAKIKDGRVYVSWNGATEVKAWELQGSRIEDTQLKVGSQGVFEKIEIIEKKQFEESFNIPLDRELAQFRVAALDKDGQVLHYSDPVEPETSSSSLFGFWLGISAGIMAVCGLWYLAKIWRRNGKSLSWDTRGILFSPEYQYSKL